MLCFVLLLLHVVSFTLARGDYGSILAEQLNQYCEIRERPSSDQSEQFKVFMKSRQTDCSRVSREFANKNNESGGVFDIYPGESGRKMEVYCDLTTDGGGWTVIQRRIDGSEDFNVNWAEYVAGFGIPENELWIGLEKLHRLTSGGNYELRIDIEDWTGRTGYALYTIFSVGDASTKYQLNVDGYSGTAGDSLSYHNGQKFSTPDQDNDSNSSNCAQRYRGGWWYRACHYSNINGEYYHGAGKYKTSGEEDGVEWHSWNNAYYYSMKFVEMKIRLKY